MPDVTTTEIIDVLIDLKNSLHQKNVHPDDIEKLEERCSDMIGRLRGEVRYGCHCDLEEGMEPEDDCVLDYGCPGDCIYAETLHKQGKTKKDCKYWQIVEKTR